MRFIWIAITLHSLTITECNNHKTPVVKNGESKDSIPVCITKKIEAIKQEPVWNPPAQVDEYLYNGKQVFLFSSNCCDQFDMLYDDHCNVVCAPSGGFTGKGDGKCTDFFTVAKHIKLVWKDTR